MEPNAGGTRRVTFVPVEKSVWIRIIQQSCLILALAVFLGLSVNHFRPGSLPLVGDWSPEAQLRLDSGDSLVISLEDAEMRFFTQTAVFLDVRSRDLYEKGHIPGALNLPLEELEERFVEALGHFPPDTNFIAYCDGEGCSLSKDMAFALIERGIGNVWVLVNGWTVWQESGLPVETGAAAPLPLSPQAGFFPRRMTPSVCLDGCLS